ncbi:hypothetical protein QQP08_011531 [Theobroma cacao]|nr:hypothetical protein QQP08_011531 [Theobroma cacao]
MALQEKLDRFNKQQEKCQTMLSNIAAKSASSRAPTPKPTPVAASPFPSGRSPAPVKFSNDTERLQHINSIRKAPVGAQMKRVIDILFQVMVLILMCLLLLFSTGILIPSRFKEFSLRFSWLVMQANLKF